MEFSSISLALNLVSNLFIESESLGIPPPIYEQSSKEEEEDSIWDAGMNQNPFPQYKLKVKQESQWELLLHCP